MPYFLANIPLKSLLPFLLTYLFETDSSMCIIKAKQK